MRLRLLLPGVVLVATACRGGASDGVKAVGTAPTTASTASTSASTTSALTSASTTASAIGASTSTPPTAAPPTTRSLQPGPTTSLPSVATTVPAADTISVGDADNGRTIGVRIGTRVKVVLGSTSWMLQGSSNSAVLSQDGPVSTASDPNCVPGGGCGTQTAAFVARASGAATVTATRLSCGEARACTPDQATFRVTITVTS